MRAAAGHGGHADASIEAPRTDSMSRKLIAALAVLSACALAAPTLSPASPGPGKHGAKAKRVKPRAVATKECTKQLQQLGAVTFKHTYGSLQDCVAEIVDEARVAVGQAKEECVGRKASGKCIFRTALAILEELLGTPPSPPPPPPLSCPIELGSVEAGLADLVFPDLSGETLSPALAQQVENFQALQQELGELLALFAGQSGPIADMLREQLAFVEQQLRAILPDLEASLNAELCPASP
jgi:hypothetical protein